MSTIHKYFEETDVESWSASKFFKAWNSDDKDFDEQISHCKAMDALFKSLRAIISKSPDAKKVDKANSLLSALQKRRIDENVKRIIHKNSGPGNLQFVSCNGLQIGNVSTISSEPVKQGDENEGVSTPLQKAKKKTIGSKRTYENGEGIVNQQKKTKSEFANVDGQIDDPTDDLSYSTTTPTTKNKPKYIQHDLAQELLTSLRLLPLEGEKWLWDGYDVCDVFQDDANTRTPLHIGVVNFHNILCSRSLPPSMITYIQQQLDDDDNDRIFFDDNRQHGIAKFGIEVDKEVEEFLEKFQDCETLDALRKALYDNSVYKRSGYNFDIKYAYQFFSHMYNIYSNDMLTRPLTETEYAAYVWTPPIRYAFMEQDIRISSGEVGSLAYEKLKKLAQQQSKSGPKLDAKATIVSTGMDVLVQENAKTDITSKRKNDLDKLEYCTKILLTNAYLALPTTARKDIHKFETYTIQTNELTLTLSAASYLFENTVCMFGLTDILIPRTVEAFSKCVEAVYKVLSWKARSCRNTRTFHGLLKRSASQLSKKKLFSPKKFTDPNLVAEHYRRFLK